RRADLAEIGIDRHLGEDRTVGLQSMVSHRGGISSAFASAFDLRQSGAGEDFGVALAAGLVILDMQASATRDHPRIACAEERRSRIVSGKTREPGDSVTPR